MNGQKDGILNESPTLFYRTASPLRPLPYFPPHEYSQSRATAIAAKILPMGRRRRLETVLYISKGVIGLKSLYLST